MSLIVENLRKRYGDFTALSDLSFEISNPGVFALLGTNGAGKTTAIRCILGILAKDGGSVRWKGKKLNAIMERIGYLSEERGLYPKYTVKEQMLYFGELKGLSRLEAYAAIEYWFDRLSINEHLNKKADSLSKGNQQKVQLASALIGDPQLLVLDEPLSGLDPVNAELFKDIIREEIRRKKFVIMSSHQMATVEEFCSDIVILNKSKVVLQGNLNKIKKGYGRVYLSVKAEGDILPLAEKLGLAPFRITPNQIDFKIPSENYAHKLLHEIIAANLILIKYELREPTLNEIFIDKAGGDLSEE